MCVFVCLVGQWCRKYYSHWYFCTFEYEDISITHSLVGDHIVTTNLPFHLCISPICSSDFARCLRFSIFTIHIVCWIEIFGWHLYAMPFMNAYFCFFLFLLLCWVKYLCLHGFYSQWIFTYKLTLLFLFPCFSSLSYELYLNLQKRNDGIQTSWFQLISMHS